MGRGVVPGLGGANRGVRVGLLWGGEYLTVAASQIKEMPFTVPFLVGNTQDKGRTCEGKRRACTYITHENNDLRERGMAE